MREQALEQAAALFLSVALHKIFVINRYIEDINGALAYLMTHLDDIEMDFNFAWERGAVKYILDDIKEMGVLVDKISAMVALQAASEKICEIDAPV